VHLSHKIEGNALIANSVLDLHADVEHPAPNNSKLYYSTAYSFATLMHCVVAITSR
jgi:hypothetical protein